MLREMQSLGVTQTRISELTGLEQATISQYINGVRRPKEPRHSTVVRVTNAHRLIVRESKRRKVAA